jgi:lysophospholipase L1-like esterase
MQGRNFFPQDEAGNLLTEGMVSVRDTATQELVPIYASDDTNDPLDNPFQIPEDGQVLFFVDDGVYDITFQLGDFSRTLTSEKFSSVTSLDVDTALDQAAASAAAAETSAEEAEESAADALTSAASAAVSRDAALLSRGIFATTAKALSKGVASVASLVGGSGGTNGTFDLAFSGGAGSGAAGRFVVAGGAVVSVVITATGDSYTSAPTISFASSSGLTGASATAVIANNVDADEYFIVPSGAGYVSLYQNVAGVATLVDTIPLRALKDSLNHANPPAAFSASVGSTSITVNQELVYGVIHTNAAYGATMPGYVTSFSAHIKATSAFNIRFHMFRPNGSGGFTCTYTSPQVAVAATGVVTYAPANLSCRVEVGDVMGVSTDSGADFNRAIRAFTTTGQSTLRAGNATPIPYVVGTTYAADANNIANTTYLPAYAFSTEHEAILVNERWANKALGFARLDENAQTKPKQMAPYAGGPDMLTTSNGTVTTSEFEVGLGLKNVIRPKVLLDTYDGGSVSPQETPSFNGMVCGSWVDGSAGFTRDGVLRSVRFPGTTLATAGSKVQAWVVRPRAALPGTDNTQVTFDVVAAIGEVTAEPTANYRAFEGLAIPVKAGDLIVVRPIGAGIAFGSFSTPTYDNDVHFVQTLAGTSLADLTDGFIVTTETSVRRRIFLRAEVTVGPTLTANGPNTAITRNSSGFIPNADGRQADMFWKGKKIGAVGTSITVGASAGSNNGYINQLRDMLQCDLDNQGVGSSGITFDGAQDYSLSATQAELIAAGRSPTYSYEVKMIGKNYDLWIFDHCINDSSAPLGTISSTDKSTFYGAYNHVIAALLTDNPTQRFMFVAPISVYAPSNSYNANADARRTALFALADKYKAPIIDLTSLVQLSASQAATFQADGLHPNQEAHDRAARLMYEFIKRL